MICPYCDTELPDKTVRCTVCGTLLFHPDDATLQPGLLLADRFELVDAVGQGGIGLVWLARDKQLENEQVACKILKQDLFFDRRALADLKREVVLARRLRHPHIVGVYNVWDSDMARFITMEYIEGHNLADAMADRTEPFAPGEVLGWTQQLCQALDYAHQQQVLHRDIKPANILLDAKGSIHLADFGVARLAQDLETRLTGEMTVGTLMFMSPEQLMGNPLDQRSDVYSLASTLYELLSGHPPFHQGSIITQIQLKPVDPIPHLSTEINAVLLCALSKRPEERYGSCGEFYVALAEAVGSDAAPPTIPLRDKTFVPAPAKPHRHDPNSETVVLNAYHPETQQQRMGDILIEAGLITPEQLAQALERQKGTRDRLGTILVRLGFSDETVIARGLERQLAIPFIALEGERFDPEATRLITGRIAEYRKCLPLRIVGDRLVLAMADPLDLAAVTALEDACARRVEPRIATESDILNAIHRIYGEL